MIKVNNPKIYPHTKKYVANALRTGWISSSGEYLEKFAKKFGEEVNCQYVNLVNSGTAALHLALVALDIKEGDEVILPALTIGACYFAIWYTGAKAIPVDIDPETFNLDPHLIEKAITAKTKAIMVVHLYGHPCDMDPIMNIAKKYKLKVIEDAAEAHGAEYKGKKVGSIGDLGCFSFYANKIVTTGEGGAITTNNKKLYEKIKNLQSLNFDPKKRFTHPGLGFKYVMTNPQAAIGLASLEQIKQSIEKKQKMAKIYEKGLKGTPLITPTQKKWAKSVFWMYAVVINNKKTKLKKDQITKLLSAKYHIETRNFFFPPQIAFAKMGLYQNQNFPVAEWAATNGFYVPSGLGNTYEDFAKVSKSLKAIFNKNK